MEDTQTVMSPCFHYWGFPQQDSNDRGLLKGTEINHCGDSFREQHLLCCIQATIWIGEACGLWLVGTLPWTGEWTLIPPGSLCRGCTQRRHRECRLFTGQTPAIHASWESSVLTSGVWCGVPCFLEVQYTKEAGCPVMPALPPTLLHSGFFLRLAYYKRQIYFVFPVSVCFLLFFSLNSCTLALKRFSRLEKKRMWLGIWVWEKVYRSLKSTDYPKCVVIAVYRAPFLFQAIFENVAMVVSLRKLSIIVKNKARGQEINQLYHL